MDQLKLNESDSSAIHAAWMKTALELARQAAELDETPVGALIVKDGQIIGRGFNLREKEQDVTMHAELIAIREASRRLGSWRLEDCTLYVTIEPCIMCAGAIVQARIAHVVFGAPDPKTGAAGSITDVFSLKQNHQVQVTSGIEADACAQIIQRFFAELRRRDKIAGSRSLRRKQAVSENEKSPEKQK